ncbi:type III-B CRISPR module-associated protein Cmr5 [Pyrobaculum calidifontis]|uniref:type III-B CRISPR module-associated protein Cmr5 n=1 Tax=Pyrobaculum calidifontis TaxID=181486 RepID=UPI0003225409|nr:type III-B CRISPR module-associated protein Cmr5 [Pyrobaculum calidifontis]
MVDWLEKAIKCVELVERHCDNEAKKAFRTRARQMPSELYYVGAPYALAILAARSSERHIFTGKSLEESIAAVCKASELGNEDKGYAVYGLCLVDALQELGIRAESLTSTLRELNKLRGVAEARLAEFVDWVKKLAEAKFELVKHES